MGRTPFVMRADGSVSAMKATDLKEVAERDARIRQLEDLNAKLAAEVDAQRPVVEAAQALMRADSSYDIGRANAQICEALTVYEARKSK